MDGGRPSPRCSARSGLPGGGFGHGYGSMNEPGLAPVPYPLPTLPQGLNPVRDFIPVAAISDLLLSTRRGVRLRRQRLTYPDIKMLVLGGRQPVPPPSGHSRVCAGHWPVPTRSSSTTPTGRRWPGTPTSSSRPPRRSSGPTSAAPETTRCWSRCTQVVQPFADARDDYDTFAALARTLGCRGEVHRGPIVEQWLEHLYGQWRAVRPTRTAATPRRSTTSGREGHYRMRTEDDLILFGDFREDPEKYPLSAPRAGGSRSSPRPSTSFGYDDCAGHPRWYEPEEWLGGHGPSSSRCT